jgi:hypothetical protein
VVEAELGFRDMFGLGSFAPIGCATEDIDVGVFGAFAAENGPECVGVIARVEAAMSRLLKGFSF